MEGLGVGGLSSRQATSIHPRGPRGSWVGVQVPVATPQHPQLSKALKPGKDPDLGAQVTAPTLPWHTDGEARLLSAPTLGRVRCLSYTTCSAPDFYPLLHI